jgi:hypothetical protein
MVEKMVKQLSKSCQKVVIKLSKIGQKVRKNSDTVRRGR